MAVKAPADKRFRRALVSPARRRPWYRSQVRAAAAGAIVILAGGSGYAALAAAASMRVFTVEAISVAGHERMSTGEVHALLEGLVGENILTVDIETWRQKLLASPWVADADIRRVLPRSVSVRISEQHAAGIARLRGVLYLVDDAGVIIAEYGAPYADLDLPIIDGLAAGRDGSLMIDPQRAALASRLLSELRSSPDLAARVSEVDVTDPADAVVLLNDDTALVRLGSERFVERLRSYLELAPVLRERVLDIDYVDLRYGERVVVKPRSAGRGAAAGTRGRE